MTKKYTGPLLLMGSDADVRYASGFSAVDPVVLLDEGRNKTLVVPPLEAGRARREARRAEVRTPEELAVPIPHRRRITAWAIALLRGRNIRRVRVPATFPAHALKHLERHGVRVFVLDGVAYPQRAMKSAVEVKRIQAAQAAAVAAMATAIELIRKAETGRNGYLMWRGRRLTSQMVREAIEITLLHHGCNARDTIVAGGKQAADPHERGAGPLRAGEPIVIDIFPQHRAHGYWGDITRTVVRGRAPLRVKEMYAAVLRAQQLALSHIRAGARCRRIHMAVQKALREAGFETSVRDGQPCGFIHGTGHGVGLDIHEAPSLSASDDILRAGHVVTVEPGLYYADCGGVRIEDTVVVTERGYRMLARYPKTLEI